MGLLRYILHICAVMVFSVLSTHMAFAVSVAKDGECGFDAASALASKAINVGLAQEYTGDRDAVSRDMEDINIILSTVFSGGDTEQQSINTNTLASQFKNNYLTHSQWALQISMLEECSLNSECDPQEILNSFAALSEIQNMQFAACIASNNVQCVQNVLDELRELDSEEATIYDNFDSALDANDISTSDSDVANQLFYLDALGILNGGRVSFDRAHLDGSFLDRFQIFAAENCSPANTQQCLSDFEALRQAEFEDGGTALALLGGGVVLGAGVVVLSTEIIASLLVAGVIVEDAALGTYVACTAGGACTTVITAAAAVGTADCVYEYASGDPSCIGMVASGPLGLVGETLNVVALSGAKISHGILRAAKISRVIRTLRAPKGGVIAEYNPINPGPLPNKITTTFRSGSYKEIVTAEPTFLYRVYGGSAGRLGGYWTRGKPTGPVQSIIDSALLPQWGNNATSVVKVRVPAGTKFYEGVAAPQGGLTGGGNQVFFDSQVNPSWIID